MKPKPEYIIYKNNYSIGQAITWHGALNLLVIAENLHNYAVEHHAQGYISVISENNTYRIVQERG